jgi:flagellar biosynthetic protein FliP
VTSGRLRRRSEERPATSTHARDEDGFSIPERAVLPGRQQPERQQPERQQSERRRRRGIRAGAGLMLVLIGLVTLIGLAAGSAAAAPSTTTVTTSTSAPAASNHAASGPAAPAAPSAPATPTAPSGDGSGDSSVTINVDGNKPSSSLTVLLAVTVLAIAPSLLLLVTSFTKIFVVLSLTRNALGLQSVPPNQVLAGLSLFLSLFVMGPVVEKINKYGIQPYLHGTKSRSQAWADGVAPLRDFMLAHTRPQEIALMLRAGNMPNPSSTSKLDLTTLIPAFVLSELRSAMIIGFVVYIPFVIIDLVVSSSLMSLGMMMLPPVSVSLPFKLLLFVLVDGWGLIVTSLVQSYHTG